MSRDRKPPTKPPTGAPSRPPSIATPLAERTGLALLPAGAVVALRVVGSTAAVIELSPRTRRFYLGSDLADPEITVKVSSRMNGDPSAPELVSRLHLVIQRHGSDITIKDQDSTNGTLFQGQTVTVTGQQIRAGDTFQVADVTLLAMDEQMVGLRPDLRWALGFEAHKQVDEALIAVTDRASSALLLIGEPDCEQRWLAEQIHCTSSRRHAGFVAVPTRGATPPVLAGATGGTAYVDIAEVKRGSGGLTGPFVSALFGATYNVRPIVAARDLKAAVVHLGVARVRAMKTVVIPPIRERREDVPTILNSLFRRPPIESKARISQLPEPQIAILKAFGWPDNFADLRRNAPRIHALVQSNGNKAAAARLFGTTPQSFNEALHRIGL